MHKKINPLNHGTNLNSLDRYGRRVAPNLPWLPFAGRFDEPQPSNIMAAVLEDTPWPKLSLSHKDTFEFYRPSEFIGK